MKDFLRAFFHYSKTERNGFLVLAFLCLFAFLLPMIYSTFQTKGKTDFSEFESDIEAFATLRKEKVKSKVKTTMASTDVELFNFDPNSASREDLLRLGLSERVVKTLINFRNKGARFNSAADLKKVYELSDTDYDRLKNYIRISEEVELAEDRQQPVNDKNRNKNTPEVENIELFNFDPNTASKDLLLQLGFPEQAAKNLLKFREKGGVIREPEDLSRIYGITDDYFDLLFPYIEIQSTDSEKVTYQSKTEDRFSTAPKISLDVNRASAKEWQKLRGIGPTLSQRIIEHRNQLGGFYTLDQIGEVYGIPDSVIVSIQSSLNLSTPHQKINLNTVTKERLTSHPYLKRKQAALIINYRTQHGAFESPEAFDKILGLSASTKKKILPYLSFD